MKFLYTLILIAIFFTNGSFASDHGERLYKKCKGCHGVDGRHAPYEKPSGVLAGRERVEIELIIKAVGNKQYTQSRVNAVMERVIKKLSDEDISLLAEYISKFKK